MAMAAMFLEVALMIILGAPEGGGGLDLGPVGRLPFAGGLDRRFPLPGDALLFRAVGEDRRAVLGADIRSLAIALGGVVHPEEQIDQIAIGDLGGVEGDLDDLGMVGVAIADL